MGKLNENDVLCVIFNFSSAVFDTSSSLSSVLYASITPPTLMRGEHISRRIGRADTALAVTTSYLPNKLLHSSALPTTVVKFFTPRKRAVLPTKFIFFAVESRAVTEQSVRTAAIGNEGNPPPLPTSMTFAFSGINPTPAIESMRCFTTNSSLAVIEVRLNSLLASMTAS